MREDLGHERDEIIGSECGDDFVDIGTGEEKHHDHHSQCQEMRVVSTVPGTKADLPLEEGEDCINPRSAWQVHQHCKARDLGD